MEVVQSLLSRWSLVATAAEESPGKEVFTVVVKWP